MLELGGTARWSSKTYTCINTHTPHPETCLWFCYWGRWSPEMVQSLSCVQLSATPWTIAHQAPLSFPRTDSLEKTLMLEKTKGRRRRGWQRMRWLDVITDLMDMSLSNLRELVMLSNHLILCWPLLLLPSIFPRIRVFSNASALHIRWPKYCNFSISPSNEYSGLISFRIDWFDLLAVQGTFKSLLQHHTLKASILWKLSWGPGKFCLNWAVYKLSTLVS